MDDEGLANNNTMLSMRPNHAKPSAKDPATATKPRAAYETIPARTAPRQLATTAEPAATAASQRTA